MEFEVLDTDWQGEATRRPPVKIATIRSESLTHSWMLYNPGMNGTSILERKGMLLLTKEGMLSL